MDARLELSRRCQPRKCSEPAGQLECLKSPLVLLHVPDSLSMYDPQKHVRICLQRYKYSYERFTCKFSLNTVFLSCSFSLSFTLSHHLILLVSHYNLPLSPRRRCTAA